MLAADKGTTDNPGSIVVSATGEKTMDTTVPGSSSGATVDEAADATVSDRDAVDTGAGDAGAPVDTDAGATVPVGSSTEVVEATITGSSEATAKSVPSVATLTIVAGAAVAKEAASVASVSASCSVGGAAVSGAGSTNAEREKLLWSRGNFYLWEFVYLEKKTH